MIIREHQVSYRSTPSAISIMQSLISRQMVLIEVVVVIGDHPILAVTQEEREKVQDSGKSRSKRNPESLRS